MRKCVSALLLVFAISCLAHSKKPKIDKFIPPAQSHGKAISGYGCDKQHVTDSTSTSKPSSVWTLILWAQYGDDHKRYWQKSYDTYQVPIKSSVKSSGETVKDGGAIGAYETDAYDFGAMDEACSLWAAQVKASLKTKANGAEVK
ncbi:MAG TPA: hypothetical protein VEJ67_01975 [Candidatus Cybelea sp.]|nr:hypothetical protein [Candidatus Cybelea sp.]